MEQVTLDAIIQQALNLMKDLGNTKSNLIRSNNRHFRHIQKYYVEHGGNFVQYGFIRMLSKISGESAKLQTNRKMLLYDTE